MFYLLCLCIMRIIVRIQCQQGKSQHVVRKIYKIFKQQHHFHISFCFYRKRKRSADEAATCNKVRTVKFIGDLCPEDFTSPECYEVVKKYLKKHNTRVNSLQKQVGRLTKKVESLKDLLSQLHDKVFCQVMLSMI